jgi:hypothetical protein
MCEEFPDIKCLTLTSEKLKGSIENLTSQASSGLWELVVASDPDKKFDKYAFVPCEVALLDKLESLYIHTLKPRLNGNVSNQEKSAPIRLDNLIRMI